MKEVIRIFGIDPGSIRMGWGVIECSGPRQSFVAAGAIKPGRNLCKAERLSFLLHGLQEVIDHYKPGEAAVEETFVNVNPRDALILGQARGIALVAPALVDIPVYEYAANSVKKSVVGRGHADKEQVQAMVRVLLPASGKQSADAADALAVALCHAHHRGIKNLEKSEPRVAAGGRR